MRTIRSRRTRGRSRSTAIGGTLVAAALVFVLARLLFPGVFLSAFAPLFTVGDTIAARTGSIFAGFADTQSLAASNEKLKEENAALSLENRTLAGKIADLTALVGTSTPEGAGILAGVLARPPLSPYDTLILSAGSDAGVAVGMAAFGEGGAPLGLVSARSAQFSRVTLFSAPGVTTDAWVGSARVPITLKGAGGGAFTASVSQGASIAEGDTAYVSGPGALPIGRVAHIGGIPSDPTVTLYIAPLANVFSTTWVSLKDSGRSFLQVATTTP